MTAGMDFGRQLRADGLHAVLQRRRDTRTIADIHGLVELWTWPRWAIGVAVGDLVADGRLTDDAYGHIGAQATLFEADA